MGDIHDVIMVCCAGFSDDEEEEGEEEVVEEMRTLMHQMDAELSVTEVGRSFEKAPESCEVCVTVMAWCMYSHVTVM